MQSRNSNNLKGIDISNHQQNVDLAEVKSSGVQVVYCKATESDFYKDRFAKQNYENAKANGLKIGFYHFFRGDTDAKVQANFFVNYLKEIGATDFDCKLCLDIESTEDIGITELTNMCIEFLEEVKTLTGKDVVVYTYTSFANTSLDNRLAKYHLWIAHYEVNTPGYNPIWDNWVGFQYSSTGNVPGVGGNCDINEFTEEILLDGESYNPVPPVSIPNTGKTLRIKYASEWSVYPLGVATVKVNACGSLNPRDYGVNGVLEYAILDMPLTNVATIQTRDYGKVNIYIPEGDNEWEIISVATKEIFINLKDFITSWRVYDLDSTVTEGYEKGFLNPSLGTNGGLSYKVIESSGNDVYSIKTNTFGVIKIYCPNDSEGSVTSTPLYELV